MHLQQHFAENLQKHTGDIKEENAVPFFGTFPYD